MAQWVMAFAARPDNLGFNPQDSQGRRKKQTLQSVLIATDVHCWVSKQINNKVKQTDRQKVAIFILRGLEIA